jgi:hypothetical protein
MQTVASIRTAAEEHRAASSNTRLSTENIRLDTILACPQPSSPIRSKPHHSAPYIVF